MRQYVLEPLQQRLGIDVSDEALKRAVEKQNKSVHFYLSERIYHSGFGGHLGGIKNKGA